MNASFNVLYRVKFSRVRKDNRVPVYEERRATSFLFSGLAHHHYMQLLGRFLLILYSYHKKHKKLIYSEY